MAKTTRELPPQTERPCAACGVAIPRTRPTGLIRRYCSEACRLELRRRTRPTVTVPCTGCQAPLTRVAPVPAVDRYCSDECKPRCSISDCNEVRRTRGWCKHHYENWWRHGDPLEDLTPRRRAIAINRTLECAVEDCDRLRVVRDWCMRHYTSWKIFGDPEGASYRHADRREGCVLCGAPTGPLLREFCSQACWAAARRAQGGGWPLPSEPRYCHICGDRLEIFRRNGKTNRRADTLACKPCRLADQHHGVTPASLAEERGTLCGICGSEVDMTLQSPNLMRASVDHIVPRARGGTHDRSNLQLSHLFCNYSKGARVG
jgi:hypothetical protein